MGSAVGRVGSFGGFKLYDFTGAGQDSGSKLFKIMGVGWGTFGFQLIGNGTGMAITVYGTWDNDTANGLANNWFPLPAPSVESGAPQWSNPLIAGQVNNSALFVKATPIAIRATSEAYLGQTPTGTATLIAFVTP